MSRATLNFSHVLLVTLLTLGLLSACSAGRPSTEDLTDALTASGSRFPVAEQQAECAAELLLASDLSDEDLRVIAESDPSAEVSSGAVSTLASLQVRVLKDCA